MITRQQRPQDVMNWRNIGWATNTATASAVRAYCTLRPP